jgi:hypothetical protein
MLGKNCLTLLLVGLMQILLCFGSNNASAEISFDKMVYSVAGTGGAGVGFGFGLSDNVVLRGEAATFNKNIIQLNNQIKYIGNVKIETLAIFLDYHIFNGSFRFTTGADFGRPNASLIAQPNNNTIIVNGVSYTVPPGNSLNATLTYPRVMPYVGVGWGLSQISNETGWRFGLDLGADIGRLQTTMNATSSLTNLDQFNQNLSTLNATANKELSTVTFYPLIKLSIGYSF